MEISLFEPTQTDFAPQQAAQKTETSAGAEFGAIIEGLITEAAAEVKTAAETEISDNAEAKGAEMIKTALLSAPVFNVEAVSENSSNENVVDNIEAPKAVSTEELFTEAKKEDPEAAEAATADEEAAAPVYVQAQAAAQTVAQAQTVQPRTDSEKDEAPVQELSAGSGKASRTDKETNGLNIGKEKPVTESKANEQKARVEPPSFNKEARIERAEVKPDGSEDGREEKAAQFAAEKAEATSGPEKNSIDLSALEEGIAKEGNADGGSRDSENHEKKEAFFVKETAVSEPSTEVDSVEAKDNAVDKVDAVPFASIESEADAQTSNANSGSERFEARELSGVHSANHAKETVNAKAASDPANSNPVQHAKEVYEKFGEGVKMSLAENGKEVRLSLHPEDLGHLQIKLKIEDNFVKAHILVDSAAVKSVFDVDSSRLRDVFAAQGLTLDKCSVELNMNSRQFENNSTSGSGSWDSQFGGKREQAPSFWSKEEPKELRQYASHHYNGRKGQGGIDIFA